MWGLGRLEHILGMPGITVIITGVWKARGKPLFRYRRWVFTLLHLNGLCLAQKTLI